MVKYKLYNLYLRTKATVLQHPVQDEVHYGEDYRCRRCPECHSADHLKEVIEDTIDGAIVLETRTDCEKCGEKWLSHWAHGYSNPSCALVDPYFVFPWIEQNWP